MRLLHSRLWCYEYIRAASCAAARSSPGVTRPAYGGCGLCPQSRGGASRIAYSNAWWIRLCVTYVCDTYTGTPVVRAPTGLVRRGKPGSQDGCAKRIQCLATRRSKGHRRSASGVDGGHVTRALQAPSSWPDVPALPGATHLEAIPGRGGEECVCVTSLYALFLLRAGVRQAAADSRCGYGYRPCAAAHTAEYLPTLISAPIPLLLVSTSRISPAAPSTSGASAPLPVTQLDTSAVLAPSMPLRPPPPPLHAPPLRRQLRPHARQRVG